MLEAMLQAGGYRVGAYTSPHLLAYNERVRVDGSEVDDRALCRAFEAVEQRARRGLAHLFRVRHPGGAVGVRARGARGDRARGRAGRTARRRQHRSMPTSPSSARSTWTTRSGSARTARQHRPGEGRDLPRRPCGGVRGRGPAAGVLAEYAEPDRRAPAPGGRDFRARFARGDGIGRRMATPRLGLPQPALRGGYPARNAAAAITALEAAAPAAAGACTVALRGDCSAALPGRFQVMPGRPPLIFDVAHNPQAARAAGREPRPARGR